LEASLFLTAKQIKNESTRARKGCNDMKNNGLSGVRRAEPAACPELAWMRRKRRACVHADSKRVIARQPRKYLGCLAVRLSRRRRCFEVTVSFQTIRPLFFANVHRSPERFQSCFFLHFCAGVCKLITKIKWLVFLLYFWYNLFHGLKKDFIWITYKSQTKKLTQSHVAIHFDFVEQL